MSIQYPLPGLARPFKALLFVYGSAFVFAAFSLWLSADDQGLRPQLALFWLAGSAVLLWAALLLARPKPSEFPQRTRFSLAEYCLPALVMGVGFVLVIHPGWHLSSQAPSGFMALLWGIGWVASWLGPIALGVLALLLAHWFGISLYLDYRQAWWRWQREHLERAMAEEMLPQLAQSHYLGTKDAQWVARKLAQWLGTQMRGEFSLTLPASRLHVAAQTAQTAETAETAQTTQTAQTAHAAQAPPTQLPTKPQVAQVTQVTQMTITITPTAVTAATEEHAKNPGSGATSGAPEQLEISIQVRVP